MAQYVTCEYCGSNLDFGEICDCRKNVNSETQNSAVEVKMLSRNKNNILNSRKEAV